MKKIRRLSLNKETMRWLDPVIMGGAVGTPGENFTTIPRSYVDGCPSTPSGCETQTQNNF